MYRMNCEGKEGTGMSFSNMFLPEMMTEDQHYRRKYRNALCEIKNIITPFKDHMDIFKEISDLLDRCEI